MFSQVLVMASARVPGKKDHEDLGSMMQQLGLKEEDLDECCV